MKEDDVVLKLLRRHKIDKIKKKWVAFRIFQKGHVLLSTNKLGCFSISEINNKHSNNLGLGIDFEDRVPHACVRGRGLTLFSHLRICMK